MLVIKFAHYVILNVRHGDSYNASLKSYEFDNLNYIAHLDFSVLDELSRSQEVNNSRKIIIENS